MQNTQDRTSVDAPLNKFVSDKFLRYVDLFSKLAIGATALCYLVGVVVVNLYFGQFGFYSLGLFRLNYVIAGIWAMVPLALAYVLLAILLAAILVVAGNSPIWNKVRVIIASVITIPFIAFTAHSIAGLLGIRTSWSWLPISLWGAFGLGFMTMNYRQILRQSDPKILGAMDVVIMLFVLSSYVAGFAGRLYGQIPANIGGGQAHAVQVLVKPEYHSSLMQLGIVPKCSESDTLALADPQSNFVQSDTVFLLLSTEEEIIFVRRASDQAISLRREAVSSIVFHKVAK